jgi:shikimate dehydrogenase
VSRRFVFIGVTTASSSIMHIFPRWRDALELGADVEMAGWDIALDAADRYREAVVALRDDANSVGALVTTHKIGIYEAARDLFDETDELAALCAEVSCIRSRNGTLRAWAKDPIAAGRSLEHVLEPDHFRSGEGHALCMGAGGSGTAIALYLRTRRPNDDTPPRLVVTDRSEQRLERLRSVLARTGEDGAVELIHAPGPDVHDRILAGLPPGSLVVNATGLGKDLPGSPLGADARLPEGAIAWELNYRGELDFLHHARGQAGERGLTVEDGWTYFINGWTAVIEEVFERPIAPGEVELLAREAEFARPGHEGGDP